MRQYLCSKEERERAASYHRERYWGDPEWRLRKINYWRERMGLEPYANANEIPMRGRRAA